MKRFFGVSLAIFFVLSLMFFDSLSKSLGAPNHYYSMFDFIEAITIAIILASISTSTYWLIKKLIKRP